MDRRTFLAGAVGAIATPLGVAAQPQRVYRVGWLGGFAVDEPLREGLRALGYVEGQNLLIEARFARDLASDIYQVLAAELVALRVEVIVCATTTAAKAARDVTQTVPIVMSGIANPVAEGLIASLSRPGGNVTGTFLQTADVTAKRLELLKEALPGLRRVAAFCPDRFRTRPVVDQWLRDSQAAAQHLGLVLEPVNLELEPGGWEAVLDGVARRGISAAVIIEAPAYWNGRARLAELALKYRLAMLFPFPVGAEAGALMSYGADIDEAHRRSAHFVDRSLKGARPADLPVEQPTRFPFFINLRTAKALGLTLPPSVLARADKVIE